MSDSSRPNHVEIVKAESDYLRGHIAEELLSAGEPFTPDTNLLLKHHGMYQQDDRDLRARSSIAGSDRVYSIMVRIKITGGRLSTRQFLASLDLCDELAAGSLRITNRQNLQIHGVAKRHLREMVRRIHENGLSTLSACGDAVRSIMCCPAPMHGDPIRDQMQALAAELNEALCPRTPAYREIWFGNGQGQRNESSCPTAGSGEVEPFFGKTYLPRKLKVAIGLASDNCVDLYTADIGLMAICEGGRVVGYNVAVGGSLGMTPSNKQTFPALGRRMAFVAAESVVDLVTAICKIHREHGNRGNRRLARLKYLLAGWGLEKFKARIEEYFDAPLPPPRPEDVTGVDDHLGWHEQGDGRWFFGLRVENGRIRDSTGIRLKSAVREICRTWQPEVRITPQQNVLFANLLLDSRPLIEAVLCRHGVTLPEQLSALRRWSMACVALPTCPLALAEAERALPSVLDELEPELARLGLADDLLVVRMSGCPNGCGRPYNADIGLVGRLPGKYAVYLGGLAVSDGLGFLYADLVPLDQIVRCLVPVLEQFQRDRRPSETFGFFCRRTIAAAFAPLTAKFSQKDAIRVV